MRPTLMKTTLASAVIGAALAIPAQADVTVASWGGAYKYDDPECADGPVEDGVAVLKVTGSVSLGDHVIGTVKVAVA